MSASAPAVAAAGVDALRGGRRLRWGLIAALALVASMALGLAIGPVSIPTHHVGLDLLSRIPALGIDSPLTETERTVLWTLRLPRVVLAGLVGGTLALCGAAYQGAFANPLADPYLLGVAAGAGLGATVAIVYARGAEVLGIPVLPLLAFAGGALGVALAYGLGRSMGAGRSSTTLILGGVAVAAFLTAAQTFLQQSRTDTLREVYDWILGRLTTVGWGDVRLVVPYLLVGGALILLHGRLLDVLGLGDDAADALGVSAARTRLTVVAAVTLATSAAVAVSGLIGFVGIIIPHAVRLAGARTYRALLPLSFVFGAAFLILCDLLARTALAPAELPIGVVTAAIGAPAFALVLRRSRVPE